MIIAIIIVVMVMVVCEYAGIKIREIMRKSREEEEDINIVLLRIGIIIVALVLF